ncbi:MULTISPECIES: KpsF/GutQ family sugar-phosphate isomerase [Aliarcobacter]|jgi:arabinose-5-phosphate isomerase|uniref:D-arabinose 5-phosphate isomerase n=3 Tax=Aliarcobacter skirrowii TaxID=28200 RepID=A0AAD0SKG4_9BACT|nr:KpsF/GutQ family sugar-phosphate isomerase [Aliarcobacter skirrowii]AXX83883.1 D-arabinose 5-phosphate isomerase [Aliarcobacter skirrowii CCUG 10374]AZL53070.1 KpsF/GutQ family sugar-phosphate isomerase [Aliarcobacter skirrowii]KAB0621919.1 KpsF/GutQ family sugar-phosphate isomerase [Aliarcobacter skirrowii CCUG 10374]MDD2507513.1 KpsF/GutQ family sugar-phosphate isomerase [Aliarcobacter skirrowii]MDD3025735.1 KpsF/GutQ family sugar-phosphate isomerase [Aliarcobacter skirrowii]
MNYKEIVKDVLLTEAKELELASNSIFFEIEEIVELIVKSKGKLIVTGVGKSGLVGAKIAATLASTGTSSFFLHPTEAMHGDLGMIGKEDIVLGISYSGESEELIQILPHLKRFNIPLIAMAKNPNSTLAKYADYFINIAVTKEACPLDTAPTSSTTLTMAMGDALAVCLMKRRDFKKEDFASFHPGGSLGKKLFVKVNDLLRKDNLPIVSRETILKDAIITMSEGRLGSVIIVDKDEKVVGLLSDGDLRRALMKSDFSIDCTVETIATMNPKTFEDENLLASDALQIIENYKIQQLIITDKNKKLLGVLHIHDLLEAGIK